MKKIILSLLFVNLFVITSCSSTNSINVEKTKSYISDDQSKIIDYPANRNSFINYESMRRYLSNEEGHKNDGYFYTLLPTNLDSFSHDSYIVGLDDKMEHNIKVLESYYIYDEDIGTYKEPTKDVAYFTMSIDSVFYPVTSDSTITTYKVEPISESTIKVTLKSNDVIAGYIYIYYGELNATDYAVEYLKTNLRLV